VGEEREMGRESERGKGRGGRSGRENKEK